MSYVIFCGEKGTEKPYHIEDLNLRIFSIEELCYYIYSNVSLCDQELIKPELAGWIENQCKLPDLAESIRVILKKDPRAERVAAQIFAYTDYLTKQEREAVCERIRKYSQWGLDERKKMRGDYFYLDGKFQDAVKVYGEMLEHMIAALFCKKTSLSDREWEEFLAEHDEFNTYVMPMEKQLSETEKEWRKSAPAKELLKLQNHSGGRTREYYDTMEKYLREWKKLIQ